MPDTEMRYKITIMENAHLYKHGKNSGSVDSASSFSSSDALFSREGKIQPILGPPVEFDIMVIFLQVWLIA